MKRVVHSPILSTFMIPVLEMTFQAQEFDDPSYD